MGADRQEETEGGASAERGVALHASAVALDGEAGDAESEPESVAPLGGKEGFEEAGLRVWRHAGAIVCNLEDNFAVDETGAEFDGTAVRSCLHGVAEEVDQDLVDGVAVDADEAAGSERDGEVPLAGDGVDLGEA